MDILIAYGLLGVFSGIMAGLLGVGGGLIIVPVLILLWQPELSGGALLGGSQTVQLAIGTSLAVIVFTSISSVYTHHRHGSVLWPTFWRLTPGILIGTFLGAMLASSMPQDNLKALFGLFELLVAAQMTWGILNMKQRGMPGLLGVGVAGGVIGAVSALVGIGGGTVTVPFLNACKVHMQKAVGTAAACGLPVAVGGVLSYVLLGWGNAQLPPNSAGFVYGPALLGIAVTSMLFAPLGAVLAHRLPTPVLKKVFAGFLVLLGVWMLST